MRSLLSLLCIFTMIISCTDTKEKYPLVSVEGDTAIILPADVNDGNVHFFTYKDKDTLIDFFAHIDGAGNLHTHFDACLKCYEFKKGYRRQGPDLICIECGKKFRFADEEWEEQGGCKPIIVLHTIENDLLTIKTADIERGKILF